MKTELEKLKTYAAFAHRFGGKFLNERLVETQTKIAPALHQPRPAKVWDDEKLTVAWLGHATVLINFYGTWLLTDPALRSRVGISVGGLLTMGPRRLVEPALAIHQLPKLDGVLLSHAHMDHTDRGTLRRLPRNSRVVVQHGNRDLVKRFRQTDELGWGDSTMIDGVRVESIEVNHWGARTLTDGHRGYGGFLLEKHGRTIVFGGDTAYTKAFARLGRRLSRVDLAILPIGAYDPYIHVHASPEQAWAMGRDLNATYLLPIHHSTFKLSREAVREPITRFLRAAAHDRWRVPITEVGQMWVMPED